MCIRDRVYTEQVSIGRVGITITGKGAGRTILRSPATRVKSTVTTTYLPRYSYVVEIKPGALATLRDLSIDGRSNATCTERYFGVRYHNSTGNLERVVVENVRGMGSSFAGSCTNIFAVGVTSTADDRVLNDNASVCPVCQHRQRLEVAHCRLGELN